MKLLSCESGFDFEIGKNAITKDGPHGVHTIDGEMNWIAFK